MKKNIFIRGFTLVELLIAISIFSVIILSVYSAFHTGILSYYKIDSAFDVYQTARTILNRMELDLKNVFVYEQNDSGFKSDNQALDFYTILDSFDKDGKTYSDFAAIKYELSGGFNIELTSPGTLKRTYYKGEDALKKDVTDVNGESDDLTSDVRELSFQYAYSTGNTDKPYDWQGSWPSTDLTKPAGQERKLPLTIKIKLVLIEKDRQKNEIGNIEFTKTIYLALGEK